MKQGSLVRGSLSAEHIDAVIPGVHPVEDSGGRRQTVAGAQSVSQSGEHNDYLSSGTEAQIAHLTVRKGYPTVLGLSFLYARLIQKCQNFFCGDLKLLLRRKNGNSISILEAITAKLGMVAPLQKNLLGILR